jgi:hypothetical protein
VFLQRLLPIGIQVISQQQGTEHTCLFYQPFQQALAVALPCRDPPVNPVLAMPMCKQQKQ